MSKILIIDDDLLVRKMLTKLLKKNGYAVITAVDGKNGIELFNQHRPNLIITDLIMPEKEGLEIIREIKKLGPNVHIIAISGGGTIEPILYLDLAIKLGADQAFSKPIDTDALLSAIKRFH